LETQKALRQREIAAALPVVGETLATPSVLRIDQALTDKQRLERDARLGVRAAIKRTMAEAQCSQKAALHYLLTAAKTGTLDEATTRMLKMARDNRGRKGNGYPCPRSLKTWLAADDLAPKTPQKDMSVPPWANDFLPWFQRPQKPSLADAYRDFVKDCAASGRAVPCSIHQARRLLGKLGAVARETGRMGPLELKSIKPFVRQDYSVLRPNDVWSADGHTFDAEVLHPIHGRPFRPEITTIIDLATRRVVGWSVALSESANSVTDALRCAVYSHGILSVFYVDNGKGFKNKRLADESYGILGYLGAQMVNSLPYASQSRGGIERSHKTVWVTAAKKLDAYMGRDMDREERLAQFKLTRKALKNGDALRTVLGWNEFIKFCAETVEEYNHSPHRSLSKMTPAQKWGDFVAGGWEPVRPDDAADFETAFRPRELRTVRRGEVSIFSNLYFSRDMAEFHGDKVLVGYDLHDASKVWLYTPEGRFITTAEINGNRRPWFQGVLTAREHDHERRVKGRLRRVNAHLEEVRAEMTNTLEGASIRIPDGKMMVGATVLEIPLGAARVVEEPLPLSPCPVPAGGRGEACVPDFISRTERDPAQNYAEWQEINRRILVGEPVLETEASWHQQYQTSAQYRAEARRFQQRAVLTPEAAKERAAL
jgi:putative transposase